MITDLLSDSFIEGIIDASSTPSPEKTSGAEFRELIKLFRDRVTARMNTYRGSVQTHYYRPASAITEYVFPDLANSDWIMVFKQAALETITSGVPTQDQVKFDSLTGWLNFGSQLPPGELLTIIYSNTPEPGSSDNTGFPYILPLTF